jgi:hypothetical protein
VHDRILNLYDGIDNHSFFISTAEVLRSYCTIIFHSNADRPIDSIVSVNLKTKKPMTIFADSVPLANSHKAVCTRLQSGLCHHQSCVALVAS